MAELNVNFYVPDRYNGMLKKPPQVAKEVIADSVKVWIILDENKDKGYPLQLDGFTPWVNMDFGWIAVEFVEGKFVWNNQQFTENLVLAS